jgi:outer membrane protein assembly factor BamA
MKARRHVLQLPAKIGLFLVGLSFFSCNVLKRVEPDQLLLTDFEVLADSVAVSDETLNSLILQKPNSKLLGIPLRLHLYNLAKPDPEAAYQDWLYRKEGRYERLEALLSDKQVSRLGESFLVAGLSNWLKKAGEAPVVIDSARQEKSLERLQAYYKTKGYFNNTGAYHIDSTGKQRAAVRYSLDLGEPYLIDTLTFEIASPEIDSILKLHRKESLVHQGDQFDLERFTSERERLTELFRNSGIWNFQESSITYDILRDTLPSHDDQRMDVELNIDNPRSRAEGEQDRPYRVHRLDSVNIFAGISPGTPAEELEKISYEDFTIFYRGTLDYKPKALTDAVFLRKGNVYRDLDRIRTYRQINNLNTFRYPNIQLVETGEDQLVSNIYLSSRPSNSLNLDFDVTHSNIQRIGIGMGASLITRNVFGGAETLSLSGRGTFGLLSDESLPEDFFTEITADINLTFPRIWGLPFVNNQKIIPNYMLPQTRVSLGTSFQKNIGLDKQTFNSILSYNWTPNDFSRNILELLNVQFVRNLNPDRYYNVYQSSYEQLDEQADPFQEDPALQEFFQSTDDPDDPLRLLIPEGTAGFTEAVLTGGLVPQDSDTFTQVFRIEERRQRLTENDLIFATNYTFLENNKENINDNNFHQFRLRVESAGNILSLVSRVIPFIENERGQGLVFGVPYSQYVKSEVEYIKHWQLPGSNVLAFRSFVGIAVPYGNADNIPFVRSYFAGGANDNRAWFPYSLGPGSTRNVNDFNEANFKLAFNLEHRFPLFGDLRGALFADVGNIWNVWDRETDPDAIFQGFRSLEDLALGTGFGLRYDFSFFVFRADLGFKTYNPAEIPGKRWFRDFNFAGSVLQIGINYPF